MGLYLICSPRDALLNYCFRSEHPTGFFFNKKALLKISPELVKEFSDGRDFVPFPWECFQAECSSFGESAIYNDVVWVSTGDSTHNKYVSSYVSLENLEDRWFSVSNTSKRIKYYLSQLTRLKLTAHLDEKDYLLLQSKILLSGYKICVWRYKTIRETPSLASHYSINARKVNKKELLSVSNDYCKSVFEEPAIEEKTRVLKLYKKQTRIYDRHIKKNLFILRLSKIKKKVFK